MISQFKKSTNKKLIEGQRHKNSIEEKQQEITDSNKLCKAITRCYFSSQITESFILYKPKDIVSGDFYWIEKINKVYFAVADCTGHGIPGAFSDIICSNALTKSLYEDFLRTF